MTHLREFAQIALEGAIEADNITLRIKASRRPIRKVAKLLEKEVLPALSRTLLCCDEIDFCIAWFGMRRLAKMYIPDVEAAIATLKGTDWVKIRELCLLICKTAQQCHYSKQDYRRRWLLAA